MEEQAKPPRYRSKYPRPPRTDKREQFLVYLPPDLIRSIRQQAWDRNEFAYLIVERIMRNALGHLGDEANWPTPKEEVVQVSDAYIEGDRERWQSEE